VLIRAVNDSPARRLPPLASASARSTPATPPPPPATPSAPHQLVGDRHAGVHTQLRHQPTGAVIQIVMFVPRGMQRARRPYPRAFPRSRDASRHLGSETGWRLALRRSCSWTAILSSALVGASNRSSWTQGRGQAPPVKNGPALGGYGPQAMSAALTASMTHLPEQLRKPLTWDRGKEMSAHAQFALATGTKVFFADPHSPLAATEQREHQRAPAPVLPQAHRPLSMIRRRPRPRRPRPQQPTPKDPRPAHPAEVFAEQLRSLQRPGVATIG